MPKLPVYESQVAPASGGVQPGNIYLPNIHPVETNTGATKMFNQMHTEGEAAATVGERLLAQQDHNQFVIESGNAIANIYKGTGDIRAKYAGATSPDTPQQFQQDMDGLISNTLENVSPQFRERVASHLVQHVGQTVGSFNVDYANRLRQMDSAGVMNNFKIYAIEEAKARIAGNEPDAILKMGSAHGYATQVEEMGLTNTKKGEAINQYNNMVKANMFDLMLVKDPAKLQQEINTPEGQAKYGILERKEGLNTLNNLARGAVIHKQQDMELPLSQMDDKGQVTEPLLANMRDTKQISPQQYDKWSAWLQNKNSGADKETIMKSGIQVIDKINDENNPLTVAEFQKNVRDKTWIMANYNEYNSFIKQIQARDKGDEKSIVLLDRELQRNFKETIRSPGLYGQAMDRWNKEKQLDGKTPDEIRTQFYNITNPLIEKRFRYNANQPAPVQKSWWEVNNPFGGSNTPAGQMNLSPEQAKQKLLGDGYK
jgi:hypothetical protein